MNLLDSIRRKNDTGKLGILKKGKNSKKRSNCISVKKWKKKRKSKSNSKKRKKKISKNNQSVKKEFAKSESVTTYLGHQKKPEKTVKPNKMKSIFQSQNLKILKQKLLKNSPIKIPRKRMRSKVMRSSLQKARQEQARVKEKKRIKPRQKLSSSSNSRSDKLRIKRPQLSLKTQSSVFNLMNPNTPSSSSNLIQPELGLEPSTFNNLKKNFLKKKFDVTSNMTPSSKTSIYSKNRETPKKQKRKLLKKYPYILHSNQHNFIKQNENSGGHQSKSNLRFPQINQVILPRLQTNFQDAVKNNKNSSSTRSQRRFQSLENNVKDSKQPRNIAKLKKIISINSKALKKNSSKIDYC